MCYHTIKQIELHCVGLRLQGHTLMSNSLPLDLGEKNFRLCNKAYLTDLLPGWEETSIAIHTEDGNIFNSCDKAEPLDLPYQQGSVIKCSIVSVSQDSTSSVVEFFKDGERVKSIPTQVPPDGCSGLDE